MLTPLRQPGVSELTVCRTRTRFLGPEFFWDPLGNILESAQIRANPVNYQCQKRLQWGLRHDFNGSAARGN